MALKSILHHEHYECWLIFVQACRKICLEKISLQIRELDHFLLKFCTVFELLYGSSMCTPNLHLHCHICRCILNFGPAHVFWLFGCEGLNGVFGSFPTNHCKIELQMIRNFSVAQHILCASNSIDQDVQEILKTSLVFKGTLHEQMNQRYDTQDRLYTLLPVVKEGYLCSISLTKIDVAMKEKYGEKYQKDWHNLQVF